MVKKNLSLFGKIKKAAIVSKRKTRMTMEPIMSRCFSVLLFIPYHSLRVELQKDRMLSFCDVVVRRPGAGCHRDWELWLATFSAYAFA
jgi:hypothetical protein